MEVSFPYEFVGDSPQGKLYRPRAQVQIISSKNNLTIPVWMVVDTGADHTILPLFLASKLGISLSQDCIKDAIGGVGGTQPIYYLKHKIQIQIGLFKKMVPIAFLNSNEVPPLLGRLGFMEEFNVEFSKNRKVTFRD